MALTKCNIPSSFVVAAIVLNEGGKTAIKLIINTSDISGRHLLYIFHNNIYLRT